MRCINFFSNIVADMFIVWRLNHVILRLLFFFLLRLLLLSVGLKVRLHICPAFCRASWYCGFASLKISWLLDIFDRWVWMECGILLVSFVG